MHGVIYGKIAHKEVGLDMLAFYMQGYFQKVVYIFENGRSQGMHFKGGTVFTHIGIQPEE